MKKTNETSTREQALDWFNSFPSVDQQMLTDKYFNERHRQSLTGREVEEIWLKETQDVPEIPVHLKPNQKQFKKFNESLFQAYIDKFSDEDKFQAFSILAKHFENYIYGFYKDGDFDKTQNNACYGSFKSRFNTLFNK